MKKFCQVCNVDVSVSNFKKHLVTEKHKKNVEGGGLMKKKVKLSVEDKMYQKGMARIKELQALIDSENKLLKAIDERKTMADIILNHKPKKVINNSAKLRIQLYPLPALNTIGESYQYVKGYNKMNKVQKSNARLRARNEQQLKEEEIKKFLRENGNYSWFNSGKNNKLFLKESLQARTLEELKEQLWAIHHKQKHSYKINVVLSVVTERMTEDDEIGSVYSLHNPGTNLEIFSSKNRKEDNDIPTHPMLIHDNDSFKEFLEHINEYTIDSVILRLSVGSGVQRLAIPRFFIRMAVMNQKMGCAVDLPVDIVSKKCILSMNHVNHNTCFFHCVAASLYPEKRKDRLIKYVKQYHNYVFPRQKMKNNISIISS